MSNRVIENTRYVIENLKHISIEEENINFFLDSIEEVKIEHWLSGSPVDLSIFSKKEYIHFIFLFNILSFSYWGSPKWMINYKGSNYDGSWALVVSLYRAYKEGINILDFEFLKNITKNDLFYVFRGNVEIPLFQDRFNFIVQTSQVICKKYNGDLTNFFVEKDVSLLVKNFYEDFPFLVDCSVYQKRTIFFDKKAQLFIADIYASHGNFLQLNNINYLTACIGYKVPQVLRNLGFIKYDSFLSQVVISEFLLKKEYEWEVEIRSSAIFVCNLIKKKLQKRGIVIYDFQVSDLFWGLEKGFFRENFPYHKIRTTSY